MKLLKRTLKIFAILIGILLVGIFIIIVVDVQSTRYLNTSNRNLASSDSYLITNVNVVPMNEDTILINKMVHIKDGIIQGIGDYIDIEGIEVVDAKGQFLSPGLIDMHVHVWDKYDLGVYLSYGATGIRNLFGAPMHLRLKKEVNDGELISPSFYTTGPKLTGPEFMGIDNLQLKSPEDAREKVRSYKKRGYDFIKTYYGLTEELFDAVIDQSRISDIDIIAHPSDKVPYAYHFNTQIKSIEHTEDIVQQPLGYTLDTLKLMSVVAAMAQSKHIRHSPTLTVYNGIYQMMMDDDILESEEVELINPFMKMVDSQAQFDRWHNGKLKDSTLVKKIKDQHDFHIKIIRDIHKAGVTIVCGTDAGIGVTAPGLSIHKELAFYKEAGLSNYEALQTATVNASTTHAIMNDMGTIEVGKVANLILIDRNPLLDLSTLKNPSTVFIKGRKLNRENLDNFETRARQRKNFIATSLRFAEYFIVE